MWFCVEVFWVLFVGLFFFQSLLLGRSTSPRNNEGCSESDSTDVKDTLWSLSRTPGELGSWQGKYTLWSTYLDGWENRISGLWGILHFWNCNKTQQWKTLWNLSQNRWCHSVSQLARKVGYVPGGCFDSIQELSPDVKHPEGKLYFQWKSLLGPITFLYG